MRPFFCQVLVLALLGVFTGDVRGATIYVDSRLGSNAYDGKSATPMNRTSGPVRSLCQAMALVCPGDTVVLANHGTPYFGGMSLVGSRFSGVPGSPLRIFGQGATITGALPIEPRTWQEESLNLWRITPIRKGHYQLVLDETPLPEVTSPENSAELPDAPPGHWCAHRGRIYYRPAVGDDPRQQNLGLASAEAGATLLGVHDVWIKDVVFENFRLDGVSALNRCENVLLENVTCRGNGRAGLVVEGTSHIYVQGGQFIDNREYSVLIGELGSARIDGSELSAPVTVAE